MIKVLDKNNQQPRTGGIYTQASWESIIRCLEQAKFIKLYEGEHIAQIEVDEYGVKFLYEKK